MMPDYEEYRAYLDEFDLTEAQKRELIDTVWAIMQSFVDQAFGLHPVQLARREPEQGRSTSPRLGVDCGTKAIARQFKRSAGLRGRKKGIFHDKI